MAGAIARARQMPRAERVERWSALYDTIRENGIDAWAQSFLARLQQHKPASLSAPVAARARAGSAVPLAPVSGGALS